jgi:hypothetical protein
MTASTDVLAVVNGVALGRLEPWRQFLVLSHQRTMGDWRAAIASATGVPTDRFGASAWNKPLCNKELLV